MKKIYLTDDLGRFEGEAAADIDPLETLAAGENVYLIPRGGVEVPPPPAPAGHVAVWNGEAWNIMTEAVAENGGPIPLEQWRETTSLSRMEFGMALKEAEILTHAETMAFLGNTIPEPLQDLLDYLTGEDLEAAEIAAVGAQSFARNAPLWTAVAEHEDGPTAEEIDAIFGFPGE